MASGVGIIKQGLLNFLASWNHAFRRLIFRMLGGSGDHLLVSLDGETESLLIHFAERSQTTPEEAAAHWLELEANEYQQNKDVEQLWAGLTAREQQVVALCCLEYSDHEIGAMLDIAYGTARTHLYNAIYKLGINKISELRFLLRDWDFSKFDRDFSGKT